MNRYFILLVILAIFLSGCKGKNDKDKTINSEDKAAKTMLQGVWVDEESDEVTFRAKGDTIYYPDTTSMPVYFKIIADTLILNDKDNVEYSIVKQAAHIFWFKNQNGDIIKLRKSDNPNDILLFEHKAPKVVSLNHVLKKDSVVMHGGERYHCYVYINPTRYKVVKATYNDYGVEVDNVYYDNIIHVSVFHGAEQLYSKDVNKQMFRNMVPNQFLSQSILSNMDFNRVDNEGFHFDATICIPDGASCYMVDYNISLKGKIKMELLDY